MSIKQWDLLGFGFVTVDELLQVECYPAADTKTPVLNRCRQGGGLTGTALVAASRLGCKCAYAGSMGNDEVSDWILNDLEQEGIHCEDATRCAEVRPILCTVIVSKNTHTRNIFYPNTINTMDDLELNKDLVTSLILRTKVLFVDTQGVETMLFATRLARKVGIPTVADIDRNEYPRTDELMSEIEHLILPDEFAYKLAGTHDPVVALKSLHKGSKRTCTAITAGERGCWYISAIEPHKVQHQPPYKVEVVDTTGCGDVFHGAYAAGIAWGWDISRCIRFASASAAIKATKLGGRAGIPDQATVLKFLKSVHPQ